jgi:hypothetical protein
MGKTYRTDDFTRLAVFLPLDGTQRRTRAKVS